MIKKIDLVKEPATVKAISESFGQETTRYAALNKYLKWRARIKAKYNGGKRKDV